MPLAGICAGRAGKTRVPTATARSESWAGWAICTYATSSVCFFGNSGTIPDRVAQVFLSEYGICKTFYLWAMPLRKARALVRHQWANSQRIFTEPTSHSSRRRTPKYAHQLLAPLRSTLTCLGNRPLAGLDCFEAFCCGSAERTAAVCIRVFEA